MVGAYLAFLLGCQFSFGHSGFGQRTCVAPPTTLGETTCSALPTSSPCSTYCPWSSTWTTGLEGFGGPSFLESGRANGAVIAPLDYNGLAMQEMPDPSVDFQRTLQQVWATLEQSLASTHTTLSGTFSQQIQGCPTRGQGWKSIRGLGSLLFEDTVGGNHPQFEDQYGDQHCYLTNSSGTSQVRRGWSCTAARTGATSSAHNGSGEAFGTTSWFAAEYGLSTGRTGAEATRSGRETCGVRSQTQPWPSQQDGEGREAGDRPLGQDTQARSGLADFCDPGGREVSQAQEHVLGDSSSTGTSTPAEDRRACSHQRGDHSCITVPSEQHQSYGGESLQQAAVPLELMDEYPDMDMEEVETDVAPTDGRPPVAPFRRGGSVTSPTKVANVHLKTKQDKGHKTDGKSG